MPTSIWGPRARMGHNGTLLGIDEHVGRDPGDASKNERPAGLSPTQRLLEQIRQDGVGAAGDDERMLAQRLRGGDALLLDELRERPATGQQLRRCRRRRYHPPSVSMSCTGSRRVNGGSLAFVFLIHTCRVMLDVSPTLTTATLHDSRLGWFEAGS